MQNQQGSVIAKPVVHRLQGRDLKRWWQAAEFFTLSLRKKSNKVDKFMNPAIRSQVQFLLTLPFVMGLYAYIGTQHSAMTPQLIQMLCLAALAGAAVFIQFLATAKSHAKRVVEVHQLEDGLMLKSPGLKEKVRWAEVCDFFKIQDDDYVLESTGGEYFVLSHELSESGELFALIDGKIPKSTAEYSFNYLVPSLYIDGAIMACLAVILAFTISGMRALLDGGNLVEAIGFLIPVLGLALLWKMHLEKVAVFVRVGAASCLIRTRKGSHHMQWEDLRSIKRVWYYLAKFRTGWFLIPAEKTEPLAVSLLEHKPSKLLVN